MDDIGTGYVMHGTPAGLHPTHTVHPRNRSRMIDLMKQTFVVTLLVSTALAALPVQAQEPRHCHATAPAGAGAGTPEQQATAMGLAFAYHEPVVHYRRACGMDLSAARAYVADSLAKSGCSVDSEFGALRMKVFDAPLREISGGLFDEGTMERNPEVGEEVCAEVATFPALSDMDRAAYGKVAQSIQIMNFALKQGAGKLK